jgi:hypothetical protein
MEQSPPDPPGAMSAAVLADVGAVGVMEMNTAAAASTGDGDDPRGSGSQNASDFTRMTAQYRRSVQG